MEQPIIAGWACAVCNRRVDIAEPFTWRCPNATTVDRHHVLQLVQSLAPLRSGDDRNPFIAFRPHLAWDAFAAANAMTVAARDALVREVDSAISAVAGTGFYVTPFERAHDLSTALGFGVDGGVWVKDETGQVAGSHKPRHLMTILLHLLTAETLGLAPWASEAARPTLAIASCGNAAFAAATLAAAASWPIRVFVPPGANAAVLTRLTELRADIVECPRRPADPAGDPCIHRFREAVAAGAIPFTVQGPENAWCLDGGRTIGWEMARHFAEHVAGRPLDRLFIQVGAGAFAASAIAGFRSNLEGRTPRLHAVQTESCAPLERAWRTTQRGSAISAEAMWPWEHVGTSAADGILDDETYDWLAVVRAMADGGGSPIVVSEAQVLEAHEVGRRTTGIDASPTGTAGLAGLLAIREQLDGDERVAVVFSGVRR
jgi:threonine synthase